MSRDLTSLATRYAGRPLLLTPRAAHELANRVRAVDPRSVTREGRFAALVRKLSGRSQDRLAMEDDDGPPPDFGQLAAYSPRYVGEVEDSGFCWSLKDGVALLNVEGPLLDRGEYFCGEIFHGYDTLLAALREASADARVRGIFVRAATPGGVVAGGLPVLAQWMRENSARTGGKPIWVYADMACSAGYWMAASADRIVAPRVGLIGSIGAVIVHENWARALDEVGVEITPIQFGAKKTDGAWWEALSDSARADLQAEIDQCGRDFVADVLAGRPQLTEAAVLGTEARVFMGHHDEAERSALGLGLIDAHAGEEEAFLDLVAQVAAGDRTVSIPASGTPSAAAPRGRASASPARAKEAVMAIKPKTAARPSAKVTSAQAALRKAQAALARARAEEGGAPEDEAEEEDEDAAPEAMGDETDEEADASTGDDEDETTAEEDDETSPSARAIAASAEARSHPALALAAIQTGQTLAQFRASVAAAGGATGGRRQLASTLGGSPRLGADGAAGKAAPRSAADTWKKNRAAALAGKRG
jgi:capsid assembly protease